MIGALVIAVLTASPTSAAEPRTSEPLLISAMQFPWRGGSFSLELTAAGLLEHRAGSVVTRRALTSQERDLLRRLVAEQRILELRTEYGTCYIDGLLRAIKVTVGSRTVHVTLCSLQANDMAVEQREAARRALRLWVAVRNLFPDQYLAEDRTDDYSFLE